MSKPQYLTSTDPEVVAVVQRNRDAWPRFREAALAWAKERGFDNAPFDFINGTYRLGGLPDRPKGFGQWTKPGSTYRRSWPYKTNVAEREAMASLAVHTQPVPGMPFEAMSVDDGSGQVWFMRSKPFVVNGVAWIGWANPPEDSTPIGDQWSECLGSQYEAAKEAWR